MEKYGLTPDELIAKDFRVIQSSRRGYFPHGRSDWLLAIKRVHERDGNLTAIHLQEQYPHLYHQGVWIFGELDKGLRAAGFDHHQETFCKQASHQFSGSPKSPARHFGDKFKR
jgi:hypothetical protein